jgi:hypothetical protein
MHDMMDTTETRMRWDGVDTAEQYYTSSRCCLYFRIIGVIRSD